jgi:hypothetical protein
MAGPSKKVRVSDEEVFCELLQENEYSDISENECSSDSEINVKIVSGGEQSVSSDEAESSNSSSIQPNIWVNSGAEYPCFPFTGKPGINVIYKTPVTPCNILSFLYTRHCGSNRQRNKSVCPKIFRKHT